LWICEIFPVLLVGLFPVAAVGKDRLGSALVEVIAQFGAVIGLVAEHLFRRLSPYGSDAPDRTIVRLTSSQKDSEKAPFSICECVYLRVAPSAGATDSLLCSPPFPPAAE